MINKKFLKAGPNKMELKHFHHGGCKPQLLFIICHLLFFISFLSFSLSVSAQQNFTEHLTRQVAGEGTVTLSQDAEITALVNGTVTYSTPRVQRQPDSTAVAHNDLAHKSPTLTGHRTQSTGYRIQIYAGGNNRQSKAEAYRMASLARTYCEGINVYTHFISPRWICRVGDFKTREEAAEQLRKMRLTQQFSEASIVRSKIIVTY